MSDMKVYTIDHAMKELHDKDDAQHMEACKKNNRHCNDCDVECHLNLKKKKESHESIGRRCNENCDNFECKNHRVVN